MVKPGAAPSGLYTSVEKSQTFSNTYLKNPEISGFFPKRPVDKSVETGDKFQLSTDRSRLFYKIMSTIGPSLEAFPQFCEISQERPLFLGCFFLVSPRFD